jgi:hypothetical protein
MKIDFEFQTQFGVFRDALFLPDDRVFSHKEIESMKSERLNNWLAIANPPPDETLEQE